MLTVNAQSWYMQVYLWWLQDHCGRGQYNNYYYADQRAMPPLSVNLCPLMRVILFWAPLRYIFRVGRTGTHRRRLLNLLSWVSLFFTVDLVLTILGHHHKALKWFTMGHLLGWELLLLISFYLVVSAVVFGEKCAANFIEDLHELSKRAPKKNKEEGPTFLDLLFERIDAAHNRICPAVKINYVKE